MKKILKYVLITIVLIPIAFIVFVFGTATLMYFKDPQQLNQIALTNPFWGMINDGLKSTFATPASSKDLIAYKIGDEVFYFAKGAGVNYQDTLCNSKQNPDDEIKCYKAPEKLRFYLAMPGKEKTFSNSMDVEVYALPQKLVNQSKHEYFESRLEGLLERVSEHIGPNNDNNFEHYEMKWKTISPWDLYIARDENGSINDYIICYRDNKGTPSACTAYDFFSRNIVLSYNFKYKYLDEFKELGKYVRNYLISIQNVVSKDSKEK